MNEKLIGVDSEWKPTFKKGEKANVAILQISDKNVAYLIDMIALAKNRVLDKTLCHIFSNRRSKILGWYFEYDTE